MWRRFDMGLLQDSSGTFQPLPYEVAHGIVRTVVLHASELRTAKEELAKLEAADPEFTKPKTKAARDKVQNLMKADRFIVFNTRTGQVATTEWLNKFIVASPEGKPVLKNSNTKAKAWIFTLRFSLIGGDIDLQLRTKDTEDFRRVRCFGLQIGSVRMPYADLVDGYGHLLDEDAEVYEVLN